MTESLPALIESARRALDGAVSLDEVKYIRDRAEALRIFAKSIGAATEASNRCAEVKLRAERRMGEELAKVEKQGPGEHWQEKRSHGATAIPARLADLGISKSQSSRWQAVASIPAPAFESFITSAKEITTAGALRLACASRTKSSVATRALAETKLAHAAVVTSSLDALRSAWADASAEDRQKLLAEIGASVDDDEPGDDGESAGDVPAADEHDVYQIEVTSGDMIGGGLLAEASDRAPAGPTVDQAGPTEAADELPAARLPEEISPPPIPAKALPTESRSEEISRPAPGPHGLEDAAGCGASQGAAPLAISSSALSGECGAQKNGALTDAETRAALDIPEFLLRPPEEKPAGLTAASGAPVGEMSRHN